MEVQPVWSSGSSDAWSASHRSRSFWAAACAPFAFPERASLSEVEARAFSAATLAGGNFFTAWPG
ncbi:hypothetical protein, partial [Streptomyces sp. NPDC056442]|uniref:hypothetical protein n=1 Tax=Streptomyces sp. NPDC056442 TaxID=3345818 RepID=UPI00369DE7D2